jgi:hypothetical protein
VRFHQTIRSESLFFPTASEVRALGRAQLDADKIAVVVGGNSILYGYGQPRPDNWTRHLQAALGERFCVLNLAQPGAHPAEFGEIAAEMLERDHHRLLFITDCGSPAPGLESDPDGSQVGRSFFWDAYYKGMIAADARRDAQLKEAAAQRAREGKGEFAELRLGQRLDAALWFQDLWTRVAYSHVSTVGPPQMMTRNFLKPRRTYSEADPLPDPPLEQRYPPSRDDQTFDTLRHWITHGEALVNGTDQECRLSQIIRASFPELSRRRTLMLVTRDSPHDVARLAPTEQARYNAVFIAVVQVLESTGMAALEVGGDYSEWDYYDRWHLSGQGGRRLAAEVAPKVRALAEKLGYLP